MTTWSDIEALLDEAEAPVAFWWRDDDAGADHADLARLLDLAARLDVPVALAAVPAWLRGDGVRRILASPWASVAQHGWSHENHAGPDEKKIELGGLADRIILRRRLAGGRQRLADAFGERFVPVLVPPWNRIAPDLVHRLESLGFAGLSTFGGRSTRSAGGLTRVDTHVDPIGWRRGGGFVGMDAALAALAAALARPHVGFVGILTHHRSMDEATWRFIEECVSRLRRHPRVRWCPLGAALAETDDGAAGGFASGERWEEG